MSDRELLADALQALGNMMSQRRFSVRNEERANVKHAIATYYRLKAAVAPRSDEQEIARPRCGCQTATVRRVIQDHGTCGMGGCPYGGDV